MQWSPVGCKTVFRNDGARSRVLTSVRPAVATFEIGRRTKEEQAARRLMTIPGIGPVTAAALVALLPMHRASDAAGTWPPGWDRREGNIPPAANRIQHRK